MGARLELKLSQYFTSKLFQHDFEITSNPDTVRSVIAEGCGLDFRNPDKIFSLKKYQDFGDRLSCNAMHLVGGASLPAFVSYFARNILQSGSVLPVTMFCVGDITHLRQLAQILTNETWSRSLNPRLFKFS